MLRIGLTGGIGAGKSSVAALLAERGAVVIDADALAREVVAPGTPGLAAVVARFGEGILGNDAALDRAALGRVVFTDPAARCALEEITHPLIAARTAALLSGLAAGRVVVHDVPLLVEKGLAAGYDQVWVVEAPVELRLQRLAERGLARPDALARIAAQAGAAERAAVASVVIDNAGDRAALAQRVDRAWRHLVDGETA